MTQPTDSSGTGLIISGITAEARMQAEAIIAEARKMAEERITFAQRKAETIRKEAVEKARQQAEAARRAVLSGVNVTIKRETLHAQDTLFGEILSRSVERIAGMIGEPGYRTILVNLIAEAATGLDASSALVNASAAERLLIDDTVLEEASRLAQKSCSHPVHLAVSPDSPLAAQGVVVTASDGRTAFNNQITTRIRRNDRTIRNRVYETVFSPDRTDDGSHQKTDQS